MRWVWIIGLVLWGSLYAQQSVQVSWGEPRSSVAINASGVAASAHFQNRFAMSLLQDDVLDTSVVRSQGDALGMSNNRIGGDYELALQARWQLSGSNIGLLFKAADVGHAHAGVPANAFELAMHGNQPFAGDTLDISAMQFQFWRYQQVGIGAAYEMGPHNGLYMLASFINGEQFAKAEIDRAWIYTSELGDTLSAGVNGQYWQSDTARFGFAKPNGAGVALDFGAKWRLLVKGDDLHIRANVYNLGFVQWSGQTLYVEADSNIEFRGIAVNDLENISEQLGGEIIEDSLVGDARSLPKKGVSNQWLPGWAQIDLMQHREKGAEFGGGFVMRWNAHYRPYGYLVGGYRFNENISTHMTLGYGGYAQMQIGLQAAFEWEQFSAGVRISNLEGVLLPGRFAGFGGRVQLRYYLPG